MLNRQVFGSLFFRILAPLIPIVILMALLGLNTASHYAEERLEEDLGRNARELYNLCDSALQGLLLEGHADAAALLRIRKGTTLGQIEEYAQQNNLQVLVHAGGADRVLLNRSRMDPARLIEATRETAGIREIESGGETYYARHFEFELWHWNIVVVRDGNLLA